MIRGQLVAAMLSRDPLMSDGDAQMILVRAAAIHESVKAHRTAAAEKRIDTMANVVSSGFEVVLSAADLAEKRIDPASKTKVRRAIELLATGRNISVAIAAHEYGRVVVEAMGLVKHLARDVKVDFAPLQIPSGVSRFLVLGTNLASAQTPEEVKGVLESTASAVGGWRLKRRSSVVLSLSALPGAAVGYEEISGIAAENAGTVAAYLFAPVGLDLSIYGEKSVSIALFVSVIDIGQLLSLPIASKEAEVSSDTQAKAPAGEAEVEREETIKFVQVFSPGAYLRFGIGDLPLTIGAGVSYVPSLRVVEVANQESNSLNAFRAIAFFAADVTILPF